MEEGHGRRHGRGMRARTAQCFGLGRCSGVGQCTGNGIEEEEHGAGNGSTGGGGRVHGERWCLSAWGGAPATRGEGLAWG